MYPHRFFFFRIILFFHISTFLCILVAWYQPPIVVVGLIINHISPLDIVSYVFRKNEKTQIYKISIKVEYYKFYFHFLEELQELSESSLFSVLMMILCYTRSYATFPTFIQCSACNIIIHAIFSRVWMSYCSHLTVIFLFAYSMFVVLCVA